MAKKQGRSRKPGRPKGKSKRKSNTQQDGGRLFDGSLLRRANKWLKDTKAISKIANSVGGPIGTSIGTIAQHYGYGVQNGGRSIGTAQYRPILGRI